MSFLFRNKTDDAHRRGRTAGSRHADPRARAPLRARHAAVSRRSPTDTEQAVFGDGLLLGRRARLLAGAGRVHDRRRLRGRLHAEPHLRGGLQRAHRPQRGRARRVQAGRDLLRGAAAAVLGGPRPDPGHAPGQRRRHAVPLRHLRRSATRSARRPRRRASATPERLGDRRLRRDHDRDRGRARRSTTPRTTTSSTSRRTRTATAAWAAPGVSCPIGVGASGARREPPAQVAEEGGHQPQPRVGLLRPLRRGSAGHQAKRRARGRASARRRRHGRQPDHHHEAVRQAAASPRPSAARASSFHSSSSSRASVCAGLSPRSTAPPAPSAQRPAQLATQARAPAGEPAAVLAAHGAERGQAVLGVALDQPQRPARGLDLERAAGHPRPRSSPSRAADAVVRGRAALAQRRDTLVGLRGHFRRPARSGPRASAPRPARAARDRARGCRVRPGQRTGISLRAARRSSASSVRSAAISRSSCSTRPTSSAVAMAASEGPPALRGPAAPVSASPPAGASLASAGGRSSAGSAVPDGTS